MSILEGILIINVVTTLVLVFVFGANMVCGVEDDKSKYNVDLNKRLQYAIDMINRLNETIAEQDLKIAKMGAYNKELIQEVADKTVALALTENALINERKKSKRPNTAVCCASLAHAVDYAMEHKLKKFYIENDWVLFDKEN